MSTSLAQSTYGETATSGLKISGLANDNFACVPNDINQITEMILASQMNSMNKDEIVSQAETAIKIWSQSQCSKRAEIIEEIIQALDNFGDDLVTVEMYEIVSFQCT